MRALGWIGLVAAFGGCASVASESVEPAPLFAAMAAGAPWFGEDHEAELAPGEHADFALSWPEDVVYARFDVEADADVDLFLALDAESAASEDWYLSFTSGDPSEWVEVQRYREPLLDSESVVVRVENAADEPITFELSSLIVCSRVARRTVLDRVLSGIILDEAGYRYLAEVEVPAGTEEVRFDLSGATRDLDMFVATDANTLDVGRAEWSATSMSAAETLVVQPPKAGGSLFVTVLDQNLESVGEVFDLFVTSGSEPPRPLRQLVPDVPLPSDPLDNAVAACVELVLADGSGSGSIVSQTGLILTAAHVVEGAADGEIVIAMTVDPRRLPVEMFRGSVVDQDEDLDIALVQIETNLYGVPLPDDIEYPVMPLSFANVPRIGDPVSTIGYPSIGGALARSTISWSRGTLVGFDPDPGLGLMLKTDAMIAQGHSGGALLDAKHRLLGVTTSAISEDDGTAQMGYVTPIQLLPERVRDLLEEARR